jgi:hypothetical protein
MLKLKKKYGTFSIIGRLLYAPTEWIDKDGTVTLGATKYHKVMLGMKGLVIIDTMNFDNDIDDITKEDILNEVKLSFNIDKKNGFTCILREDTIPTEFHDTIVTVDKEFPIYSVRELAINDKSVINGKIEIPQCQVKGYVVTTKDGETIEIENEKWDRQHTENTIDLIDADNHYFLLKLRKRYEEITSEEIDEVITMYKKFLDNDDLPKGVRYSKVEGIEKKLMELCGDFSFLKYYNDLIKPS